MSKPPSWNEIRHNAVDFSARWADETDENQSAQTFWNEFLAIFGIDRKRVATFEARAKRTSTGGSGRIDLLWPGTLITEHKSAGKSLEAAEEQALDYLESIDESDFPGVVVASDFARIRIRDLGGDSIPFEFPLTDLVKEIDRFGFIAGYKQRHFSAEHEEAANIEAAQLMGRLYEHLANTGYEGHEATIFMTRLLFLLFGDDTGMWEKDLLAEFIETRTNPDGSDLGPQLAMLFQTVDRPVGKRPDNLDDLLRRFPHINGHIFHDRIDIPAFNKQMREELLACSAFDWGNVHPAIFGSLFQALKSKEARRVLGEHYTTEKNILRALRPLLLDELREEFDTSRHSLQRLKRLHTRLGRIRLMDPACGCGNFIVVAYRELRQLELEILMQMRDLTGDGRLALDATLGLQVSLDHFYGIEIEEWPAKIAETALFLIDHQANMKLAKEFGQAPDRLPISISPNIFIGNALTTAWRHILAPSDDVVVVGNPPFIGSRLQSEAQREDQERTWPGEKRRGTLDYVTNWFKVASEYVSGTQARVALVATNSITQGEQPAVLWTELWKHGMHIDFAHRTFAWASEAPGAANVHVVIVGFSARPKPAKRRLWVYPDFAREGILTEVHRVSPYLIDAPDVVVVSRQKPLVAGTPPMLFGSMPRDAGHISNISASDAQEIRLNDPLAAKYLRRIIGAEELINGAERWCLWLVGANPTDIANSPVLVQRLAAVRKMRQDSKAASTAAAAATPGLFVQIAQPNQRYLAVPAHSSETREYIPTQMFDPDVIAMNAVLTVPGADDVLFGIMSSRVFTAWSRTISGRLESRIRVSQEITYNNFPWLPYNDPNRPSIEAAARKVLTTRASFPGATLATLYNPLAMPPDLATDHKDLDNAVLKAYGLKSSSTEAKILAALLVRYEALVHEGTLHI
jgi:hypothetical protein